VNRPFALALAALAFAACGGGGAATSADGGDGGRPDGAGEALPAGWSSFDVVATLALKPPDGSANWTDFPRTVPFTLVFDPDAGEAIVGGGGPVSAGPISSAGGASFRLTGPVAVGVPFTDSCLSYATIVFDEIVFSDFSHGGAFHGTARGNATYQMGDQVFSVDMTATLEGRADATPPVPRLAAGAVSPLEPFTVSLSEPLPATATASLLSTTTGKTIPLDVRRDSSNQAITAFLKPAVVLDYADVYKVVPDEIVDFAGLAAADGASLILRTGAPPTLVPEDGFESVAGDTFGGAGVLHGGPLTPIAGETSLILNTGFGGGFGFLPYHLGPGVALRLAVSPGDTVVRFKAQLVAVYELQQATFFGDVRVGSPGGTLGRLTNITARDFAKVTLPVDGDVYVSPVATIELPLPAGTTDQVVFEIAGVTGGCGLPPPPTALIIDDLRVE
jgi:hypothetical protein